MPCSLRKARRNILCPVSESIGPGLGERPRLDRLAEDRGRLGHRPAHLAEHDVGAVATRDLVHPFEGVRAEFIVLVDELDVLGGRGVDADVARLPRPAGVLLRDEPGVRMAFGDPPQPVPGAVGRSVVDVDDLVLVAAQALLSNEGAHRSRYSRRCRPGRRRRPSATPAKSVSRGRLRMQAVRVQPGHRINGLVDVAGGDPGAGRPRSGRAGRKCGPSCRPRRQADSR